MKVQDLSGAELDYWVAKALRFEADFKPLERAWVDADWSPSIKWAQGGPIIEREKLRLEPAFNDIEPWIARADCGGHMRIFAYGPTPLIAAMRAFVASKFGEEVHG